MKRRINNELDKVLIKEIKKYHDNILIIDSKYEDLIINDYYLTYISMLLCRDIALKIDKYLSRVDHSPSTKVLYYYEGDI